MCLKKEVQLSTPCTQSVWAEYEQKERRACSETRGGRHLTRIDFTSALLFPICKNIKIEPHKKKKEKLEQVYRYMSNLYRYWLCKKGQRPTCTDTPLTCTGTGGWVLGKKGF